jgi:hypothetical protein
MGTIEAVVHEYFTIGSPKINVAMASNLTLRPDSIENPFNLSLKISVV